MTLDLSQILTTYRGRKSRLNQLGKRVLKIVQDKTRSSGIRIQTEMRLKDESSLLRKCIRYGGGLDKTPDLVGVKVIPKYPDHAGHVCKIIESAFIASDPDIKVDSLDPDELGYLGIHYQVKLRKEDCPKGLKGLECEIIVHTAAEALWDSHTHELLWKPLVQLAPRSQRALYRLMALVELYDKEMIAVRREYTSNPDYRTKYIIDVVDKYFMRFDPVEHYDQAMTVKTVEALAPIIPSDKLSSLDTELEQYVSQNQPMLNSAYSMFKDEGDLRGLFLHQPESLLIFALLDWDEKSRVKRAWEAIYPVKYLQELGSMVAVTIPD